VLVVPVAVAWLFLHVCVVAGGVVLLVANGSSRAELTCTCGHGADHASCPMHHRPTDSARCRLRSVQHDLGSALMSMLGLLTLPVATTVVTADVSLAHAIGYDSRVPIDRSARPDLPPPRS
jgi:hypothetical protein